MNTTQQWVRAFPLSEIAVGGSRLHRADGNQVAVFRPAADDLFAIDNRCPHCGHPPQVGVLRPEADGSALTLVCSLCLSEWSFPRSQCAACGERDEKQFAYYSPEQMAHLQTQVCDTCRRYLHHVDLAKELQAVPDVDEIAALPLDVWALERGYQKLHPNLVGI